MKPDLESLDYYWIFIFLDNHLLYCKRFTEFAVKKSY